MAMDDVLYFLNDFPDTRPFGIAARIFAAASLCAVLRWAAIHRAKVHQLARQQHESGDPVIDWRLATWAVATCL